MIKSNLAKLMANKKIRSISELSKRTGLSRTTLTAIYFDKNNGIQYNTLDSLLRFFDADVGELLMRESDTCSLQK
ncbi:helix-turn-helix transcriptional regulator [Fodinisporobacter ferrooxydans]|uniref:Helix-turn-helix transcriptional regulator n=1 Tax=Fodinisporobacter ferrooxydans TaxID=2901836 RepID=A0ABY4CKJ2_9BACL|nr:helix-turn-helix transcriptional regulator [Alicyclobacillaceae bacterium MYW30-H2]